MLLRLKYLLLFLPLGHAMAQTACDCPDSFNEMSWSGDGGWCFCCPGTPNAPSLDRDEVIAEGYCCVHSSDSFDLERRELDDLQPHARQITTTQGQVCSTVIPFSASDYSSLALAATKLLTDQTSSTSERHEATATSTSVSGGRAPTGTSASSESIATSTEQAAANGGVVAVYGKEAAGLTVAGALVLGLV